MPIPGPGPVPPGLSVTSQQLLASALRLINVLASGETMDAAEGEDALSSANQLLDSWQTQRLTIYSILRQVFSLSGQQTYTMGPGGNFNVARPARIDRLSVINLNNPVQPLELPLDYITDAQWQAIPVKAISSALPQLVWDDQQFPLRNLNYWPIPNQFPVQTAIYSWSALSQFADLGNTLYTFPPAYMRALRFNLAVDLAPEYGVQNVSPLVMQIAAESKGVLEAMNAPMVDLKCDPALVTTDKSLYNWITDMPVRR